MSRPAAVAMTMATAIALLAFGVAAGGCRTIELAGPDRDDPSDPTLLHWTAGAGTVDDVSRPSAPGPLALAELVSATAPKVTYVAPAFDWIPSARGDATVVGRPLLVGQGDEPSLVLEGSTTRRAASGTDETDGTLLSRWRSESAAWPPLGFVLRLHGLQTSPLDRRLDRRLLDAGWMMVRYDSIPFGGLGFTAPPRAELAIDTPQEAGAMLDEQLARIATGAAAVLRHERSAIGDIFGAGIDELPVIIVGTSLGGIFSPTTAVAVDAELRATGAGGVAAMVLLAAGGDTGRICAESPAMDFEPSVVAPATLAEWRRLMRGAIDWSRLDPLHVAPSLRHVPALMLHARFDAIVPAHLGEQLWIALGRPDRFSYLAGHIGLLGLLAGEADAVMQWLEGRGLPAGRAVRATPAVPAAPHAGPPSRSPAGRGPVTGTVPRTGD